MSVVDAIVIVLLSTAGAMVQASVGIGLTLVAGPALIAIDNDFVPGPFMVAGQLIAVRHIVMERAHADRVARRHCFVGIPFGVGAGLVVLEALSERAMTIVVGTLAATGAAALLAGLHVRRSRTSEITAGAAAAFSSVSAALPGPPVVIAFHDMPPSTMRATAASILMTIASLGLVGLIATGNFGGRELELLLWLLPGVCLGLFIARWTRPLLDRTWFQPAVLTVAMLGGVALVVSELL